MRAVDAFPALPLLRLVFGTGAAPESAEPASDEPVAEHRGARQLIG
jgi:hypothetical protein